MTTFAALGIQFPLFEGPVDTASEYVGAGVCIACRKHRKHRFELGIGAGVIVACPRCGAANGLDADDAVDQPCRSCRSQVPFPQDREEDLAVCYQCLRDGRAALTKNTTLGMIGWDQALEVTTQPDPALTQEQMFELLRTPGYVSLQGEHWELCCSRPMTYVGTWTQQEFNAAVAGGNGRELFDSIIQDPEEGLWEGQLHDETGIYVFRCQACGRMKANWDIA